MKIDCITINKEILGGTPVFTGTRVPISSLFSHLEEGISLDEFLEDFPSVNRGQAIEILEVAERLFNPENLHRIHEIAA